MPEEALQIAEKRREAKGKKKKKCKKARGLPEEALQIAEKRREAKGKGRKEDVPI